MTQDLFSDRLKKTASAGQDDIYRYDNLTMKFCNQVIILWQESIGRYKGASQYFPNPRWRKIQDTIAFHKGLLIESYNKRSPDAWCQQYLIDAEDDDALDIIEVSFGVLCSVRVTNDRDHRITKGKREAIRNLNELFRRDGLGYEFVVSPDGLSGQIIQIGSTYIHSEIVVPAISLLRDVGFPGPNTEFMKAHGYYRDGDYENAITWAERAFESTMKAICEARAWSHPTKKLEKLNAGELINLVLNNELVDPILRDHLCGLNKVLEAGLPTVRNNLSAHGSGREYTPGEAHVASYALHLAAANIVFLVEAHKSKSQ